MLQRFSELLGSLVVLVFAGAVLIILVFPGISALALPEPYSQPIKPSLSTDVSAPVSHVHVAQSKSGQVCIQDCGSKQTACQASCHAQYSDPTKFLNNFGKEDACNSQCQVGYRQCVSLCQ
jgi:hypothetical protein